MDPQNWHFQAMHETLEEYRLFELWRSYDPEDAWSKLAARTGRDHWITVALAHKKAWGPRADAWRAVLGDQVARLEQKRLAVKERSMDRALAIVEETIAAAELARMPPQFSAMDRTIYREAMREPAKEKDLTLGSDQLAPLPRDLDLTEEEAALWFAKMRK